MDTCAILHSQVAPFVGFFVNQQRQIPARVVVTAERMVQHKKQDERVSRLDIQLYVPRAELHMFLVRDDSSVNPRRSPTLGLLQAGIAPTTLNLQRSVLCQCPPD